MTIKLDFDDVLIVPQFSDITSRSQVNVVTTLNGKWGASISGVPIIAANMDGVGTFSMNSALAKFGAFTAITKHTNIDDWMDAKDALAVSNYAFITIGMNDDELEKAKKIINTIKQVFPNYVPKIVIDVANGYMNPFYDFIKKVRDTVPDAYIMAGTVVTPEAVVRIIESGADLARVGIGTGAVCTTRRVAGVGYPQLSALMECVPAAEEVGGGVQSDGGCVFPGDFSKAFGVGAKMVMAGSIFAGHDESEQEIHDGKVIFYGMSSVAAQEKHKQTKNYRASEGRVVEIPYKGEVENTVNDILGGIRSTCTYIGAINITEMSEKAKFIQVNNVLNRSLEQYTVR
jgi:GMP reductase